jgi:hypothetical protein
VGPPDNFVFFVHYPMLLKDSAKMENEFRTFLRSKTLKLSALTLPTAFDSMAEFWTTATFSGVLADHGDGIACYEDVTDHGRGTRLEIGLVRLLRLRSLDCETRSPVHRLRLRVCYKWDMDVIKHVLPAGTWSFACWDFQEYESFKQTVLDTTGFSTMRDKKPAEVNATFDIVSAVPDKLRPSAQARQMWWGVA